MPKIDVIIHKDTEEKVVIADQKALLKEPGKLSEKDKAINAVLIDAGRTILMQSITHYGNLTGDYITQNRIGESIGVAGDILMIAKGGIAVAIAVGMKYATQAVNSTIQQRQNNLKIDYMRRHVGYIEAKGSRYGDIT